VISTPFPLPTRHLGQQIGSQDEAAERYSTVVGMADPVVTPVAAHDAEVGSVLILNQWQYDCERLRLRVNWFTDTKVQRQLVQQSQAWLNMTTRDLRHECRKRGVSLDGVVEKDDIMRSLRQAFLQEKLLAKEIPKCDKKRCSQAQAADLPEATSSSTEVHSSSTDVPEVPSSSTEAEEGRSGVEKQTMQQSKSVAWAQTTSSRVGSNRSVPLRRRSAPKRSAAKTGWASRAKSARPNTPSRCEFLQRPADLEADDGSFFYGSADISLAGPRVRKALQQFPSYSGEMPPDLQEAEDLWTDTEIHNFFFSSGYIRPKAKDSRPKVTRAMRSECYCALGLPCDAKLADVRQAYRKLALQFHPDKNCDSRDSTLRFQQITEAYFTLCRVLESALST